MKLITFTQSAHTRIGLLQGDHVIDLSRRTHVASGHADFAAKRRRWNARSRPTPRSNSELSRQ